MSKHERLEQRLHDAIRWGSHTATEEELELVTAVVLVVVADLAEELSAVIADLEAPTAALEAASS